MNQEKWNIVFGECEHGGDLDHYASALKECGADVFESRMLSSEEETGVVGVVVDKDGKRGFLDKLRASEVVGFIEAMSPLGN
ncbi:MAG: hypothetical protein KAG97_04825 [Victivallales bacterium]|nr:hypothetical protein [Victivallales bacterium]